jgi:hypothetical protein
MKAIEINNPWQHWIVDDFLNADTLAEVKSVEHIVEQAKPGKRVDSVRLFINEEHEKQYPYLYHLYRSLRNGAYKTFFEHYTGIDYTDMYPRVEVISDIGDFWLEPHYDRPAKKLSALLYTDYTQLYPGTGLGDGTRVESKDNRCFFFVAGEHSLHDYPLIHFPTVRRCLQINYWTYE